MRLEFLRVLHIAKAQAEPSLAGQVQEKLSSEDAFYLASCQRFIWVTTAQATERSGVSEISGLEIFTGSDAYEFLLRVATGLESQIKGETDIFGQIKEAWAASVQLSLAMRTELSPWFQRLFEDTKDIRTQFIKNAGGASYGSLLRLLLKNTSAKGPVLLIGAGKLAQAIAPYLTEHEVWIRNRSVSSALFLQSSLQKDAKAGVRVLESTTDELDAWTQASTVILCVPLDPSQDSERIKAWKSNEQNAHEKIVIHLGTDLRNAGEWKEVADIKTLDDLYSLERTQSEVRSLQIVRASDACTERAKLRALGASLSISHGWEDLAVFA